MWQQLFTPQAVAELQELVTFDSDPPTPAVLSLPEQPRDDVRIMITSWGARPLDAALLDKFPRLELMMHAAGTVREVLPDPAVGERIKICTASQINARPVAEFTLGIILTALRETFSWRKRFLLEGPQIWWGQRSEFQGGYYGKTVCLVGFGAVAEYLISLLRPFEFEVLVVSDYLTEEKAAELQVTKTTLLEAAPRADVVSLHEADLPPYRGMINREVLEAMKPGAWLINTARGRLIDEEALIAVLEKGHIWAALDVACEEPPRDGHPFYRLENCILTPHIAGSLRGELARIGDYVVREIRNHLEGKPYEHELRPASLGKRA
ncbi:MAG: D-isomer specific 2-hydroxyacid dehydrogenase NAD-binding subunit [Puniceicoccaceae bacterium 5H]|nr:MAG: D-isomer specific 2-hydroxyacid dehydrogenase NAD-binding subunit [Puniceicoccaceae bacterium 5H]